MPRFPVDFSKIEDRQFPVYPPGRYILRIVGARQEAARSSGELKETVEFEIVTGPGVSQEFSGKKIIASYSLQQQAGFRIARLLNACRIPKEQWNVVEDEHLIGCMVSASLSVEDYQGKNVNRVGSEDAVEGNGASAAAKPGAFVAPQPAGFGHPAGYAPGYPPGAYPPGYLPGFAPPPVAGLGAYPGVPGPMAPAPPPAKPFGAK